MVLTIIQKIILGIGIVGAGTAGLIIVTAKKPPVEYYATLEDVQPFYASTYPVGTSFIRGDELEVSFWQERAYVGDARGNDGHAIRVENWLIPDLGIILLDLETGIRYKAA